MEKTCFIVTRQNDWFMNHWFIMIYLSCWAYLYSIHIPDTCAFSAWHGETFRRCFLLGNCSMCWSWQLLNAQKTQQCLGDDCGCWVDMFPTQCLLWRGTVKSHDSLIADNCEPMWPSLMHTKEHVQRTLAVSFYQTYNMEISDLSSTDVCQCSQGSAPEKMKFLH